MSVTAKAAIGQPARQINPDIVRAVAIVMVILLHLSSPLVSNFNGTPPAGWWIANAIDSFCRPCVPFFLLLSGYFLLDPSRDESAQTFFSKRVRRVVLPFLVWDVIFIGWNIATQGKTYTVWTALKAIIQGRIYFHLWYVYTLIGLYLVTPILRVYVRAASKRNLTYFVALWALATGLIPLLNRLMGFDQGINFVVTTGFAGYFIAGPLLRDVRVKPNRLWLLVMIYLLGCAATMFANYRLTADHHGQLDQFFFQYTSPAIIVMALSGFVLLNSLPFERLLAKAHRLRALIVSVGTMSLGIYLIHVMFLDGLHLNAPAPAAIAAAFPTFGTLMISALIVLALSYVAVSILRWLPFTRWIVP